MPLVARLCPFLLTSLLAAALAPAPAAPGTPSASDDSSAVAVVELFTSQGCSSCPPADRLLRTLVRSARDEGRPVYALSFHVNYWNHLGWQDPYSNAAFSQRQRQYSRALGVDTYTPQIVVNGARAMVGSRERAVHRALSAVLDNPAPLEVTLTMAETEKRLQATYTVSRTPPAESRIHVALVERGLSRTVSRGENAGRTLHHANVVRQFRSASAQRQGTLEVSIPDAVDPTHASIIAYVQAPSLTILGATRADLWTGPVSDTP